MSLKPDRVLFMIQHAPALKMRDRGVQGAHDMVGRTASILKARRLSPQTGIVHGHPLGPNVYCRPYGGFRTTRPKSLSITRSKSPRLRQNIDLVVTKKRELT